MAENTSSSRFPSLPTFQDIRAKFKFSLPSLNIGARLWDNFVEGFAPDRRSYDVCYFPLVHKNVDGTLTYFGTFVPDLYELARAENKEHPFKEAILLPKKAYMVDQATGLLSAEDLRSVASQVSKKMFVLANDARAHQENLNLYHVDRIPAQGLYFNAKSGVAQSLGEAQANDLINVYGGARGTKYELGHIAQTNREKMIHAGLNWLSRGVALISGMGAALAFGPTAPFAAAAAGFTTYYIVTSANQFSFWDKAEDLLKNNWLLSSKHAKAKQLDFVKIAKTIVISAMVGFLAYQGGMGAYAEAMGLLSADLPALAGVVTLGSKALLAIKATAGVLAATAGLGAFRGLMWIMHNWMGLGYAKTAVTPEERNALAVDDILAANDDADNTYSQKSDLKAFAAKSVRDLLQVNEQIKSLESQLKQAQNPCVSKVVALETILNDLVEKGEIDKNDLNTPEKYDEAFRKITALLPMNLGAWAPAQVFHDLPHAEQMKAIEAFKAGNNKASNRFEEYKSSPDYQNYLVSARYTLDKDMFKAYLDGNTYNLKAVAVEEPMHDCCSAKKANVATEAGNTALDNSVVPEPVMFGPVEPPKTPVETKDADVSLDSEGPSVSETAKNNPALDRVKAATGRGSRGNSRENSPARESSPSRTQPFRVVKGLQGHRVNDPNREPVKFVVHGDDKKKTTTPTPFKK